MATETQILANRANAQKSTGPRTAAGKAVVSRNAVKHGLCGREVVIQGEDPGEFESHRERMLAELDPIDEIESSLAERIVSLSWRLQRAEGLQTTAFDSLYARQKHCPTEQFDKRQDADGDSTFGRALVRDFANNRVLDRLLMYERRIEHSLYRTMAELKRHRILQEVGPGKMWELRRALASEDDAGTGNHRRDARAAGPAANSPADAPEGGSGGSDAEAGEDVGGRTAGGEPARSVPVRAYPCVAGILPALRGRDALDTITPDGVTTNEDGRATEPAAGTPSTSARTSSGEAALETSHFTLQTSQTNPISPARDDGQVPREKALTVDSPCDESDETKPISDTVPSARCAAAPEISAESCNCPAEAPCQRARSQ